ncbi:MAG: ATP-binding protein [Planctomycetes bacterium]|nr:ATP-binding protein [Planctomycetota bacterium]
MQAADAMIKIAADTTDASQRTRRKAMAAELIEFAKQCDQRVEDKRTNRRSAAKDGDDTGGKASDWIIREVPTIGFDDIAGLDEVKHEIRLKMIYPFAHPELASQYKIGVGGGLLLYGPPGTGKTMIAKAIAKEIEATMFVVSPAQVLSKWVGEAEQNIRKLFEAAKAEPKAIIFIDEIEAMVPSRRDSNSSVMTRVVPQILQEIEGFDRKGDRPLLFVGATNEPWALDSAMMRPGRFDAKVYVCTGPAQAGNLSRQAAPGPDVDLRTWWLCSTAIAALISRRLSIVPQPFRSWRPLGAERRAPSAGRTWSG